MKQLSICVILVLIIVSCNNNHVANSHKVAFIANTIGGGSKESLYIATEDDYYKNQVTTEKLKGGYEIYYTITDSFKYVYLKGDKFIKRLDSLPLNEGSFYYLGILLEDYHDLFVFGHDNGNGAPYSIELINKKTGENILGNKVVSIEGKYDSSYLVYYDDINKDLKDRFILYNIVNAKREFFRLPNELLQQNTEFNFIHMTVDTISKKQITTSYELNNQMLTQKYIR